MSLDGHNKVMTANSLLATMNTTSAPNPGDHASHLCGKAACVQSGHVVFESREANEARKRCVPWVDCPHGGCGLKVAVCKHVPPCLLYIPGVSWEEFQAGPELFVSSAH